jgi:glycosyltransferase involved in cell wall biosynthesis
VHGHASIGGALARLAAPRRLPVVWTPNGVMTIAPVVATERVLRRRTAAVVAVSPSERDLLVQLRLARPDQVAVIRNGIDLTPAADGTDLRALVGIPADAPVAGMVARLAPQKAPLDFVEAARLLAQQLPDVHFVLIGDGKLAPAVDAAVARWDHDARFHRVPSLPGAARVLGQLDVFVLTSRYEGGPYTPLEAMREGTPVVVTNVVGSRDTVSDRETGLVVEPGQPRQTAQAMFTLLTGQEFSASIVKRSRDWLVEQGDVRHMAADHTALYERLARRHDRSGTRSGHRGERSSSA